jgi:Pvc16 N-terminal domain
VSTALAISAVTAALRDLLTQGLHADPVLSDAEVTAAPVHKAPKNESTNQVNLFLYQTTTNTGWSNSDPPTARAGDTARPLLALDLHYLLTVYGKGNDEVAAHRLLGRAMRVLHDHPVLGRQEVASALNGDELGDQIERIRITPEPLTVDEMSKLWSSFQKEYRMSTAYQASVVLIESDRRATTPLPVLTRGEADRGVDVLPEPTPPFPALERAEPPDAQEAARLDEEVTLHGAHLDGDAVTARLAGRRLAEPLQVAALADPTDRAVRIRLPSDPAALPAGLYAVSLVVQRTQEPDRETNAVPLAVAPELLTIAPSPAPRDGDGNVAFTVTCRPQVLAAQPASLLLGSREIRAEAHDDPAATLTFPVTPAPPGQHWLRLRVDGVDSLLVDRNARPPVFDPSQRVTIS